MEKYSRGWRGAPAKGVGRSRGARVQIPLSPLFFCLKMRVKNKIERTIIYQKPLSVWPLHSYQHLAKSHAMRLPQHFIWKAINSLKFKQPYRENTLKINPLLGMFTYKNNLKLKTKKTDTEKT